jgi:hypothetical protein
MLFFAVNKFSFYDIFDYYENGHAFLVRMIDRLSCYKRERFNRCKIREYEIGALYKLALGAFCNGLLHNQYELRMPIRYGQLSLHSAGKFVAQAVICISGFTL